MNFPAEILPGFDCRFFIGVGNQSGFYNTLEHNSKIQEFFMSEQKKIKVAVIAAGSRARLVVKNLLRDSERNVVIASVFDPDTGNTYTVTQELGHNSIHPLKRYLVETRTKSSAKGR